MLLKTRFKKTGNVGLHWYKGQSLGWNLVQFIINFNLIDHRGKFKEGDVVRYNWMAKIQLGRFYLKEKGSYKRPLIVTQVLYSDKSGIEYKDLETGQKSGCDSFWLRKAYWWEY